MRFVIKFLVFLILLFIPPNLEANSFQNILRKTALDNGILPAKQLFDNRDKSLAEIGKQFFESEALSLNRKISCKTCHLKEFSSTDGIPNAVGVGGKGHGQKRLNSGGKFVPRNTLALWGRGGLGFDTLFWDGKVDFSNGAKLSQFGDNAPSDDPLVVAVHLPAIEIGEMLVDDKKVKKYKKETAKDGFEVYQLMTNKLRDNEKSAITQLSKLIGKKESEIRFIDIARAIASFIRSEFKIKETKFQKFLFENGELTDEEIRGGLIFYGKGKCSNCHNGPYFTDFKFYSISLPQLGFGKNGFGIDYGRFNVTFDPNDLYKFRTPPLHNVSKTGPYGHSGSVKTLKDAIAYHFDPLRFDLPKEMDELNRHEYYKKLAISSKTILDISFLTDQEVDSLVSFLKIIQFD
jgi:cytochrome c peroxidase